MLPRTVRPEHEDVVALAADAGAEAQCVENALLSDETGMVVQFRSGAKFELAHVASTIKEFGGDWFDRHIVSFALSGRVFLARAGRKASLAS